MGCLGGGNEDGGGWRPWEEDPQWLHLPHLSEERGREAKKGGDTEAGLGKAEEARVQRGGHWLRVTGGLVWCARCACYANKRHGVGLKGVCYPGRGGAAKARLARLHQGLHPITGRILQ